MTGLVRKATLLGVCGLLSASTAMGAVPSAGMSKVEAFNNQGVPAPCVRLVGTATVTPAPGAPDDAQGKIIVKVRDFLGNAIPGSHVVLDFNFPGSTCPDSKLCLTPVAGQTLTCGGGLKQVSGTTDALGNASFTVLGASYNTGSTAVGGHVGPSATAACVKVLADGVELSTKKVAILDQNGSLAGQNGVNGADTGVILSGVIAVLGGQPYLPRLDINCDNGVNGGDTSYELARVIQSLGGAGSGGGCPAGSPAGYCPL